jgi:cell cycle sensor histidine kinase DivJ
MLFVWLIFPTGALALAATGKLMPAEAICSLSFIAAGSTAALGDGTLHPTTSAWLFLAPVWSAYSARASLTASISIMAAMVTLLSGASAFAASSPAPETASATVFLVPAAMLAVIVSGGFAQSRKLRGKVLRDEPHFDGATLAEAAGCVIVSCDPSGTALSVSSNSEALVAVPPADLMGRGFFERVHVADRPAFLKAISDARAGAGMTAATFRWRGPERLDQDGHAEPVFLWLEMRARRIAGFACASEDHQEANVVAIVRDVTGAKAREAVAEEARAAAGEVDDAKNFFLTQAGHELRAPLTAIAGFSEILADPLLAGRNPAHQREYASIIHESARHLLSIIDSMLDLSAAHSGSFAIEIERFAVAPLIDLCCDMVKLQARHGRVELIRACQSDLGEISSDRRLFTQIFVNLLSNAVKFTPPHGRVTVSAEHEGDFLAILVADTGIGIAAADLGRLGDPFFQAKGSPAPRNQGTGLGLSIVRGLVGLLGGAIAVASEPGKGTCVRVLLPVDGAGNAAEPRKPAKIETLTRLPAADQRDTFNQRAVKKIA